MAHELAIALQQAGRIRQPSALKEPHVYVRIEYIDVAEGRISQTCNWVAVMQKLPDFVPAFSHHLKPAMRDGSQFTCMLFHPRIDGGIPLDSAVESQQFRSHRYSAVFGIYGCVALYTSRPLPCRALRNKRHISSVMAQRLAIRFLRFGGSRSRIKSYLWNNSYGSLQLKFAASSMLPVPLYFATCGCGHKGRVRSTLPSVIWEARI